MANSTMKYHISEQTSPVPMTQQPVWLISEISNCILTCISLWLILSVGIYGCRSGKFISKTTSDCSRGLVLKVAFIATLLLLPRILATQAVILVGFSYGNTKADFDCEVAEDVSIVAYYISLFPVYLFLWVRQRSLYQQPSIKRLYNKLIQVSSWGCLVFLIASGIGIIVIFVWPLAYTSSERGCVLRNEKKNSLTVFYVLTVVLVAGQLILLSIFIYPLLKHRNVTMIETSSKQNGSQLPSSVDSSNFDYESSKTSATKKMLNDNDVETSRAYRKSKTLTPIRHPLTAPHKNIGLKGLNEIRSSFRSTKHSRRSCNVKTAKRLKKIMQRSITCAIVCIVSDIAAIVVVGLVLPRETPKSLTNTLFDVSLVINVISLIASYENYKNILFSPLYSWKKVPKMQSTPSTSRTANETTRSYVKSTNSNQQNSA